MKHNHSTLNLTQWWKPCAHNWHQCCPTAPSVNILRHHLLNDELVQNTLCEHFQLAQPWVDLGLVYREEQDSLVHCQMEIPIHKIFIGFRPPQFWTMNGNVVFYTNRVPGTRDQDLAMTPNFVQPLHPLIPQCYLAWIRLYRFQFYNLWSLYCISFCEILALWGYCGHNHCHSDFKISVFGVNLTLPQSSLNYQVI